MQMGYGGYRRQPTRGGRPGAGGTVQGGAATTQGPASYAPTQQSQQSSQPQMPYQPGAPKTQGLIDPLAEAGQGLLDPDSAYSQRMREQMVGGIGQQTEAMQRGAVLNASRAGFGTGAGAELLETQGDIGRSGLEAQGQASADMALKAPALGGQMMQAPINAQLALQGQGLQGFMGQQQLGAQQQAQIFQAQLAQQQQEQERQMEEARMQMQAQQLEQEMYLREMGMMYS